MVEFDQFFFMCVLRFSSNEEIVLSSSLVPRRFLIEKKRLLQAIYTDHLRIEQARKGDWGGHDGTGKCLAENDRFLDIFD